MKQVPAAHPSLVPQGAARINKIKTDNYPHIFAIGQIFCTSIQPVDYCHEKSHKGLKEEFHHVLETCKRQ